MSAAAATSSSAAAAAATSTGGTQQGDATQQSKNNNQTMRDASHAWEAVDGSSMWTDVQEDADGNILTNYSQLSLAAQIRQRRHRLAATDLARSSKRLVRHMLRHVYLVLDCSQWSREKDPALPPARMRLETTLNLASEYINEYYDQNPLGHLGIVLCKDGEAEMLTALGGSPKKHKLALGAALVTEMSKGGGSSVGGEFSLQNGIEVAGRSLGYAPRYGSREIIVITSALATCDPGDILAETLPRLLHSGIRVSTISLQAELHICTKLAEATGGLSGVCMDTRHLRDLVMGHAIPPPINSFESGAGAGAGAGAGGDSTPQVICEFVTMGFPSREGGDVPTLVHSTGGGTNDKQGVAFAINPAAADDRRSNRLISFARTGYVCPRCRSRCSDLPSDCAVCGLRLILAPHLARTFHHLFPVRPFMELEEAEVVGSADIATNKEPDMNGENANRKNGLEALPVQSSSAFTPSSAISSSNVASFVVSSSTSSMDNQQQNVNSSATKVISIGPSLIGNSADCDRCCFGCLRIIGCRPVNNASQQKSNGSSNRETANQQTTEAILRFQCPECRNVFCPDCDAFLHETLHNCPGCLSN